MAHALFISGKPRFVDHTPVAAVSMGQIVVIGQRPYVAHRDIAAGEVAALAAEGGVYDIVKSGSSGPVITAGDNMYWDAGASQITNAAGALPHFGPSQEAASTSDALVRVLHSPTDTLGALT